MRAGAVDAACELTLIPGEFCLIDETLSPIIERKEKTQSTKFDLKWISFHLAVALMRKLSIWSDRQPSIYLVNSLNWTLNWRQAAITSTKRDSIEPTRRVTWPTVPLFPTVGLWWYKKKNVPSTQTTEEQQLPSIKGSSRTNSGSLVASDSRLPGRFVGGLREHACFPVSEDFFLYKNSTKNVAQFDRSCQSAGWDTRQFPFDSGNRQMFSFEFFRSLYF